MPLILRRVVVVFVLMFFSFRFFFFFSRASTAIIEIDVFVTATGLRRSRADTMHYATAVHSHCRLTPFHKIFVEDWHEVATTRTTSTCPTHLFLGACAFTMVNASMWTARCQRRLGLGSRSPTRFVVCVRRGWPLSQLSATRDARRSLHSHGRSGRWTKRACSAALQALVLDRARQLLVAETRCFAASHCSMLSVARGMQLERRRRRGAFVPCLEARRRQRCRHADAL